MKILTKCPRCTESTELNVPDEGVDSWYSGAHIQEAFPDLGVDDRERLLSGFCPKCWSEIFADEDS